MIEVRELIVRARVEDSPQDKTGNASGRSNTGSYTPQSLSDRDLRKIVSLCAEEVIKALKRKMER